MIIRIPIRNRQAIDPARPALTMTTHVPRTDTAPPYRTSRMRLKTSPSMSKDLTNKAKRAVNFQVSVCSKRRLYVNVLFNSVSHINITVCNTPYIYGFSSTSSYLECSRTCHVFTVELFYIKGRSLSRNCVSVTKYIFFVYFFLLTRF